jgi:diguanylate cyclase (GGDEF)-like protein
MKPEISTQRDAIFHTAGRVSIAVLSTAVLTPLMIALTFGVNPKTNVPLSDVATHMFVIGGAIAALLAGALSYRSALLMKELNRTRAELLSMSQTDQLTGLLNRRGYNEAALLALAKASEAKVSAVALMCDIDRFKAINDRFGHDFGDKVLVKIGEAMHAFGKEHGALVARHGGEEFVALMVDVGIGQAIERANELRRICAAQAVWTEDGSAASVTVSIGLAADDAGANLTAMMRAADDALYLAKRGGRDRVVQADVKIAA